MQQKYKNIKKFNIITQAIILLFLILFYTVTVNSNTHNSVSIKRPNFERSSNQTFLDNVNQCIDYVYSTNINLSSSNRELTLAQAALESGWGKSRFAIVGKNLFGIRTYDLTQPHMTAYTTLLDGQKPPKWGLRVYEHECDSVLHYINTLNNGSYFTEYQNLRNAGEKDPLKLMLSLDSYAGDRLYFKKLESIILKIRKEYKMNYVKKI